MSKHIKLFALFTLMVPGASLLGQGRSAITPATLDAAVTSAPTLSRTALQGFLATDQVKRTAAAMRLNPADLSARVDRLDQASLNVFARRTQLDDRVLAGGRDTIIISATTVIIVLLLLILLTD